MVFLPDTLLGDASDSGESWVRQQDRAPGGTTTWVTGGVFFFFQAEDGIRDYKVTGVQTCALPICARGEAARERYPPLLRPHGGPRRSHLARRGRAGLRHARALPRGRHPLDQGEIGRAACRGRG